MKAPRTLYLVLVIVLLHAGMLASLHAAGESPTAIYEHGNLSLSIPYHALHQGSGRLQVELLDPEDRVLWEVERPADIEEGTGTWRQNLAPENPLPIDDLVWERVHYRFTYTGSTIPSIEGTDSVSQILLRPVVRIIGQKSYLSGSDAAIRVIVMDTESHEVHGKGTIRVELVIPNRKPVPLFSGNLNRHGTTEAQFRFPAGLSGSYQLHFIAETPIGSAESTQPVQLDNKVSILLTTEKPIYQPGQTIHVRALALDRADHKAVNERSITLELEDSRGNKVFKKVSETDRFGIAATEFTLADEVNLGTYHLRALMGEVNAEPVNKAEIALNVERYVLPKFKVAVEFAEKNGKPRKDYRPGDHVIGTVRTNYFFGKPVDHAEISVKATAMDVSLYEANLASGTTDKDGNYQFDLILPDYFAGRPISAGAARVLIEATVKDSAGHAETRGAPITVSQSSLLITAVPEGGNLIPHLENQIFILTAYPDGTPAKTDLTIHRSLTPDQHVSTDDAGIAVIRLDGKTEIETLQIDADDRHGSRASSEIPLETRQGTDQILLRTGRAVYRSGDPIQLTVLSTRQHGTAYIDIVKDGQTILTRGLEIEDGHAELSLTVTPAMAGTLDIDAYLFTRDAQAIGDHRLVFVQPPDELKIETIADAAVYKPGDEARVHFRVTNAHGEGVSAALGVQVVDEAVFALAEKQPGFAKVFFYLEQEVMKPRYEIHSISMDQVVEPIENSQIEQQDRAARALFAATEMTNPNQVDTEFGKELPQAKYSDYSARYHAAFMNQVRRLATQLSRVYERNEADLDPSSALSELAGPDGKKPRDAWGTELRFELTGSNRGMNRFYQVHSAGPDKQFNTGDDLTGYIDVRAVSIANPSNLSGTFDLRIEHDRGPLDGRTEIVGSVTDQTGAVIPNAKVALLELATGATRHTTTSPAGQFTLSAVPAGRYTVKISSPGFQISSLNFTVRSRDWAILASRLTVGQVTQTVMVNADAAMIQTENANMAALGGMNRGIGAGFAAPTLEQPAIDGKNPAMLFASIAAPKSLATGSDVSITPHIRSYFPDALYINPEIITDGNGIANVTIPIADSVTTWRMAMLASTVAGSLGTGVSSMKVFQDFFVDLDLPVTLTQGDRISIPVAIYNYTGKPGDVRLTLQPGDWFNLVDNTSEKSVSVESGRVGSSEFTLEAKHIGKFKLTVSAKLGGTDKEDVVVREIDVIPNGREQNIVFNGRMESTVQHDLQFPTSSIPEASKVFVRLYPGPLSQIIEGMDSILRMPGGCFEQTSSSTYPNVLALDYMKRTKKLTPEVHAKAEGYIANGYQRLLTFEVPGGGFSWFGQAPANKILTAYGLMEFNDMSKVYEVDPRLIERTRNWLAEQQRADGSWKPDTSFINEGATNRYNSDILRITAYIAWALTNTGYDGPAVDKAKDFIEKNLDSKADPYTLAIVANFAVEYRKDREFTQHAMHLLLDARTEKDEQAWWSAEETGVYSTGASAAIETTGLAAQALLKSGESLGTARKALTYIASKKDATGAWGSTQATIIALRALLLASQMNTADVHGNIEVLLNGKVAQNLKLTSDNSDLLHQFVLKGIDTNESNSVELRFDGTGGLAYQIVGKYFVPWEAKQTTEPLSIEVNYDRTKLARNDIATATATARNNLNKTANMVMIDLGIPPGFDLLSEDLQDFQEQTAGSANGKLEKFSLTATQAILYFNSLSPNQSLTFKFRLRAKYPIRTKTFQSRVYEYYDPEVNAIAPPVQLDVVRQEKP